MTATRKFSIGPLAILGVVSSIMISLPQSTEAFAPSSHATLVSGKSCTSIRSIFEDGKDEGGGGGIDFRNFNPLKQSAGNIANMPSFNTQISLRKVQMQEMTGELLNVVGNEDMTNQILNRFKDFLLQPLEDPDTILVSDQNGGTLVGTTCQC